MQANEHQAVERAEDTSLGEFRRSTLICCRRTRISASSRARERNKPMSADHNSMKNSIIGHEHHLIRVARQPDEVSDRDRCLRYPRADIG